MRKFRKILRKRFQTGRIVIGLVEDGEVQHDVWGHLVVSADFKHQQTIVDIAHHYGLINDNEGVWNSYTQWFIPLATVDGYMKVNIVINRLKLHGIPAEDTVLFFRYKYRKNVKPALDALKPKKVLT